MRRFATAFLLLAMSSFLAKAQVVPADKADDARIDGLLKQMTLEEKMNLIRGDVEPAATNQGRQVICRAYRVSAFRRCAWPMVLRAF